MHKSFHVKPENSKKKIKIFSVPNMWSTIIYYAHERSRAPLFTQYSLSPHHLFKLVANSNATDHNASSMTEIWNLFPKLKTASASNWANWIFIMFDKNKSYTHTHKRTVNKLFHKSCGGHQRRQITHNLYATIYHIVSHSCTYTGCREKMQQAERLYSTFSTLLDMKQC